MTHFGRFRAGHDYLKTLNNHSCYCCCILLQPVFLLSSYTPSGLGCLRAFAGGTSTSLLLITNSTLNMNGHSSSSYYAESGDFFQASIILPPCYSGPISDLLVRLVFVLTLERFWHSMKVWQNATLCIFSRTKIYAEIFQRCVLETPAIRLEKALHFTILSAPLHLFPIVQLTGNILNRTHRRFRRKVCHESEETTIPSVSILLVHVPIRKEAVFFWHIIRLN